MISAFSYDEIPVLSDLEPGRYRVKVQGESYSLGEFSRSLSAVSVNEKILSNEQHTVLNCTPAIGAKLNVAKLSGNAESLSIGWSNCQDIVSYRPGQQISYTFQQSDLLSSRAILDSKATCIQVNTSADNNADAFVRSVQIGSNITKIEPFCFKSMPYLTAVHFADGDQPLEIGEYAFANDIGLISHLVLPKRLKTIRKGAFANCNSLKVVTIPDSAIKFERGAFYNCKNLRIIVIECTRTISIGMSFFDYMFKDGRLFTNAGLDMQHLCRQHALKYSGKDSAAGQWPLSFERMKDIGLAFDANKIVSAKCAGAPITMRFRECTSVRTQTIFPLFIESHT